MQVRQVPFLQELGNTMSDSRAASSKDIESAASKVHPCGWMTAEKRSGNFISSIKRISSLLLQSAELTKNSKPIYSTYILTQHFHAN